MTAGTGEMGADEVYLFDDDLPIHGIEPGSTLFVAGSGWSGAEELALSMVLSAREHEEGMVFITNTSTTDGLLDQCATIDPEFDRERVGVVDCSGQTTDGDVGGARIETVASSSDLTGIGIKFSSLYGGFHAETNERVRTGFVTVSTLLMYSELRTVYRFLHTISGRVAGTDGLCIFVIDPSTHEDKTVNTLNQLCDGRIDVRETDAENELRVRGLPDQPEGWIPYSLETPR